MVNEMTTMRLRPFLTLIHLPVTVAEVEPLCVAVIPYPLHAIWQAIVILFRWHFERKFIVAVRCDSLHHTASSDPYQVDEEEGAGT